MRHLLVGLLGIGFSTNAWAAFDVYLDYPGIPGDSLASQYTNQIELGSISIAGFRVGEVGNMAGIANPKLSEVKLTKNTDRATPLLFLGALNSTPNATDAVFSFQSGGGGGGPSSPFLTITLKNPTITGFEISGSSGDSVPSETVTLGYDELCISHQPFDSTGNPSGTPVERCWNATTSTGS